MNRINLQKRSVDFLLRRVIITVLLCLFIYGPIANVTQENTAVADDAGTVSDSAMDALCKSMQDIEQQLENLTQVQKKIDIDILRVLGEIEGIGPTETPDVQAMSENTGQYSSLSSLVKTDRDGNIQVELTVSSINSEQLNELRNLGMNVSITLPEYSVVEGWLPGNQVEAVANLDFVTHVGTPGYPIYHSGLVNSQGDSVLKADLARAQFGVDGSGVKIGVISDGVTHLANSVASGDLPSSPAVSVLKAGSGDEGTAMLEIIHDLAPGAQLAFYGINASDTSSEMILGIRALEAAGCRIVVDDITFSNEPKFEDGPIALETRAFVNRGGVYVTSCGNEALTHYYHVYNRVTTQGLRLHQYGGGETDVANTFTVENGQKYTVILQWNNLWGYSGDNFDIGIIDSSLNQLAWSNNVQDGNDNPYEAFQYTHSGSKKTVYIGIREVTENPVPSSIMLDYHVWNSSNLNYYTPGNSVIGHEAVEEVLSTAAVNYADPTIIEAFSSQGPGTIYFPNTETRWVPNITATDRVNTYTGQAGYFSNPFSGTSAAAPHVAAIAALVWDADPTLTSASIRNAIMSKAVDLGTAGWDNIYGWGRVDAYEAVKSVPLNVTINQASGQADPTNSAPINFTVIFGKSVSDFTAVDVTLNSTSGATTATVTGSGTTYNVAVSGMTSNGTVIASIDTSAAHDAAGNPNTTSVSNDNMVTYDSTKPTVVLTSTAPNPTKISPIPVTATFSEAVTGFVVGDITVGNGTASNLVPVNAMVYNFDVTPGVQGLVTVDIAAGVAQDGAGNFNSAATRLSIAYDTVSPTVILTSTAPNPTKTSPISVTATFSEAVTSFVVGNITVGGGTASNLVVVSATVYTFDITPATQGLVTVDIRAGVTQDSAGNGNTAATQLSRTYDSVSPTVTLTSTASNQTKISPFPVTATFNEPVSGFVIGDIVVGNGTAGNFVAVSTTVYTFDVTPTSQGAVTVDIAADVAQDTAGNGNIAATRLSRIYDITSPTVTLTSTATNLTKTSPIPFTATFNEAVTGFVVADITVGNGNAGNFAAVSATVYNFNVTPSGQGTVTVDIAAGVAQDGAGNWNTAADRLTRSYDSISPTVTLTTTSPNPTKLSPIHVTATFSEAVTGFVVGDITVGNGTTSNFTAVSATVYTFDVTPASQGAVTVDIAVNVAQDNAGNGNTAALRLSRIYDTVSPSVILTSTAPNLTKTSPIPVMATFNEAVTGFAVSDITVGNGTAGNFIAVSAMVYTFDVTPAGQGLVTVDIAAGVVQDSAGNGNTAATQLSRTYDSIGATVTLTSISPNQTNTSPIPVVATFNDPVFGFVIGDIVVGNGTSGNFVAVSTTVYTFDVTPISQGVVTVDILAGVAEDNAGNGNTAAVRLSRTYDTISPNVTLTSTTSNPTNASPIPVTASFNETVNGFLIGDIVVSNGTTGNFTAVSAAVYTFDVTPASQGVVTVDIASGVAQDSAGNWNTAALRLSRTYDTVSPYVTLTTTSPDLTKTSPIPVTATFSKAVTGFVVHDITVGNGTAVNFVTVSATVYTFDVTPASQGLVTVDIAAGVAQDSAGNGNMAATQLSRTYDSIGATVTLTSTSPNPTNTSPIPVIATFNEPVSGFVIGDIVVGNGTSGNFVVVSTTVYTFDVTPISQGVVTVDIATDVAQDITGNGNIAATRLSRLYDTISPTVTLTSTTYNLTNASPIPVTATFNEPVSGFVIGDIVVSNGTTGNFTAVSTAVYTFDVTPASQGVVSVDIAAGVAQDSAGNGNTAATQLSKTYDSLAPTLIAAQTKTTKSIAVSFSEDLNGATVNKANFTVAGNTVTLASETVSGVVTLTLGTALAPDATPNVTYTKGMLADAVGNKVETTTVTASDGIAPTLTSVHIASSNSNSSWAKAGDTVTLTINAGESLQTLTATVAGHVAKVDGSGTAWMVTYTMAPEDTQWVVSFNIAFSDTAGNAGTPVTSTTDGSSVITIEDGALIRGLTCEIKGMILSNVTIKLIKQGEVIDTVVSDSQGSFMIIAPEPGDYVLRANNLDFREKSIQISVTQLGHEYRTNFKGNNGLIPDVPDIWYVLDCAALWKYQPQDCELSLDIWGLLNVAAAWKYPRYGSSQPESK